jgi:hypothetical protein
VAVSLVFMPILTFRDANDNPIPFARVWSYQAGTTTPLALYADPAGASPMSNPAITDAGGRLVAYATVGTAYKLDVFDSANVHVPGWPIDNYIVQTVGTTSQIAGYSSLAEMRLTLDPGEVGTEVLPTSLAQWQQEIQFILQERGRTNTWYESYTNCTVPVLTVGGTAPDPVANLFPGLGTTSQTYSFAIPPDWRPASNLTWVFTRKTTSGTGTAMMQYAINRERNGQPVTNIVTNTAVNFAPGNLNAQEVSINIPGASLVAGDVVTIPLRRFADDVTDTDMGDVIVLAASVTYTTAMTVTFPGLQLLGDVPATVPNLFPPTSTTTQTYSFLIPQDWRSASNLTWVFFRKTTSGAGTAIMNYTINRERDGQAVANIVSNTAINFLPGNANIQRASATIPGTALLAGDVVTIPLQRLGDDPGDTDGGNILVLSSAVTYESSTLDTVRTLHVVPAGSTTVPNLFPPSTTTTERYSFPIPDGWQSLSNMTWVLFRKSTSAAGTAIMNYTMDRERAGQGTANIVTNTAINFVSGTGNPQQASATIPGANLLPGDVVTISLQRFGDDPSDTDFGAILIMSSHVVYRGLAGT